LVLGDDGEEDSLLDDTLFLNGRSKQGATVLDTRIFRRVDDVLSFAVGEREALPPPTTQLLVALAVAMRRKGWPIRLEKLRHWCNGIIVYIFTLTK